jgi:hypothetical protein
MQESREPKDCSLRLYASGFSPKESFGATRPDVSWESNFFAGLSVRAGWIFGFVGEGVFRLPQLAQDEAKASLFCSI